MKQTYPISDFDVVYISYDEPKIPPLSAFRTLWSDPFIRIGTEGPDGGGA